MSTLKSLLNDYLSKEEIISLIDSYDVNTRYDKNELLLKFHTILCRDIYPYLIGKREMANVCGSGSVGFIVSLESDNFTFDKFETQTQIPLYRIKKSKLFIENKIPKNLALKIQILDSKDKYWEARIIREEFIQNKLSESASFRDNIPNFYFGCTINMPIENDIIRFRLTFMELLDSRYITILTLLQRNNILTDEMYNNIEQLVKKLWKFGISHNDLSINNILIDVETKDIKLIDFGLSSMMLPLEDNKSYIEYFKTLDKSEQNGSNVSKLNELFTYVNKV